MSKEFPQFNEDEQGHAEGAAKPKKTTAARARKAVPAVKSRKTGESAGSGETKVNEAEVVKAPVAGAKVPSDKKDVPSAGEPEWSETVPESVGESAPGGEGGGKRKRRRRKGKGGGSSATVEVAEASAASPVASAPSPAASTPQAAKSRIHPELLAKAAWKIYLAEVSEEGVALVGDQDARELARRCFRLAEIFMEEQGRRSGAF